MTGFDGALKDSTVDDGPECRDWRAHCIPWMFVLGELGWCCYAVLWWRRQTPKILVQNCCDEPEIEFQQLDEFDGALRVAIVDNKPDVEFEKTGISSRTRWSDHNEGSASQTYLVASLLVWLDGSFINYLYSDLMSANFAAVTIIIFSSWMILTTEKSNFFHTFS